MNYDDYSNNILWDVIETKSKYNNVYVKFGDHKQLIERFAGGIIRENNKNGYIDKNMNITIPAIYDGIYDLAINNDFLKNAAGEKFEIDYSNYVRIYNDRGNGIANKQGKILMECQYSNIIYYGYNTFVVTKKVNDTWKMGVVDINNNIVIDFIDGFMTQEHFTSSQYAIYSNYNIPNSSYSYEGVIDRNFNVILQPIYNNITIKTIDIDDYHEYYFVVELGDQRAVFDIKGNKKIDFCYFSAHRLCEEYEKTVRNSLKNN